MKVYNMTSPASRREVANQFEIYDDNGNVYFQSYQSIIAKKDRAGNVTLDEYYWDFSTTTGKYRNQFLGFGIEETRRRIKDGRIKLENLN